VQLLLVAKGDDLKASTKLMKGYKNAALANKGKLVFVTVSAVSSSPAAYAASALSVHKLPVCQLQACPLWCCGWLARFTAVDELLLASCACSALIKLLYWCQLSRQYPPTMA
jgi:hypothetical protein